MEIRNNGGHITGINKAEARTQIDLLKTERRGIMNRVEGMASRALSRKNKLPLMDSSSRCRKSTRGFKPLRPRSWQTQPPTLATLPFAISPWKA